MIRRKQFHFVLQFLLRFALFATTLTGVFIFAFLFLFSRAAFKNLRLEAETTAVSIAESVDFATHSTINDPSDVTNPSYQRIFHELLLATKTNPDLTFVYTMRPLESGEWVFVIDASVPEDENDNGVIDPDEATAEIGEVYDISCCPNLPLALHDPTSDETFSTDAWGTWISGYAPIYDEFGVVDGIVGVDISIERWLQERRQLYRLVAITLLIALAFIFGFGILGVLVFSRQARVVNEALSIRNEELESQVKLRTRQLQIFMAAVVHELRAPLTAMRWQLEEMTTKRRSKAEQEQIHDMREVTVNLARLVGEFLDVTKMSTGKFEIVKHRVNPTKIIKETAELYVPQAEAKGLTLNLSLPMRLPSLRLDATRIQQVLSNLISNAIKYADHGVVNVRAFVDGKFLRVEVQDDGLGMTSKQLKKLFQPFVRVGNDKQIGTGLGLVIVKGIVEGHGGTVGVQSKKGVGSTFWFTIPIK